jgi:NAD+ diphosphatase
MITFVADFVSGQIKKSNEVEGMGWSKLSNALNEMKEDIIGTKVVEKVLNVKSRR